MSETNETQQNTVTRRQVVAAGAAVAGAAVLGSVASSSYAAGSGQLKLGIVGCGGRGTGALSNAFETSHPLKLVAMGDAFRDRLDMCHNTILKDVKGDKNKVDVSEDKKFVGFDAFKQVIDSGVDAVILTTSPGWRPYHFEYAIQQGKHVFMEKPVATDAAGIRKVLEVAKIAQQKNLKVAVGLQRHHQAVYEETVKRIHDGAIGEVLFTRVYWNGNRPWVRNRKDGQTEMEYQMRNWYYFNWLCGDHIEEQHIHNIDVSNWIMGKAPSLAQGAGGCAGPRDKDRGEIFDHHSVEFVYGDHWDGPGRAYSMCRQIPGCWNSVSEFAYGTKGWSAVGGGLIYEHGKDTPVFKHKGRGGNPYVVEHDVQWDCVLNNKPHNEAEYGAMSTATAILGRAATYSGTLVRMADFLKSDQNLFPEGFPQTPLTWKSTPRPAMGPDGFYPIATPGKTKPFGNSIV